MNEIVRLEEKLNHLLRQQENFQQEIANLKADISRLKQSGGSISQTQPGEESKILQPDDSPVPEVSGLLNKLKDSRSLDYNEKEQNLKLSIEKFIGENLANKIGIIITVIGVAIGVKYAIDHELISPLVRIVSGYFLGFILLALAIKLRNNYANYSSVLFSGSMAIMYFITFAAYDFYKLVPLAQTYGLMIAFTIFTVYAAIHYNKQVIAHIGLVGSYAVPFLLGAGFDNIVFLFTYISIINTGILVLAFVRNWKSLFISAFILTWIIYASWFFSGYNYHEDFSTAIIFLSVNFVLFYIISLAYKLLKNEKFVAADVVILLANASVYFGLGFKLLKDHQMGIEYPGMFAVINGLVHLAVCFLIFYRKQADRNLLHFVFGLALVCITIAIPMQLDGRWVTLLWTGEALILFRVGSTSSTAFYKYLSYPIMLLAFISLVHDWAFVYDRYDYDAEGAGYIPFFNISFLTSILFIGAFSLINYYYYSSKSFLHDKYSGQLKVFSYLIPAILIIAAYYSIRLEIAAIFDRLIHNSQGQVYNNSLPADLRRFKSVWLLNYSLLFVSALSWFNLRVIENRKMFRVNLMLNVFYILLFLTGGLYTLSELRGSYLGFEMAEGDKPGVFYLIIRYVTFLFVTVTVVITANIIKILAVKERSKNYFELALYLLILWVSSSELIHWMDLLDSKQVYKAGLSILWGTYALILVSLGIIQRKSFLRIGAIVLFGATLLKLFFYDISHLGTLQKTLIFILLGSLLLVISFLYNKYKHLIFDVPRDDDSPGHLNQQV
ncbi:MAG: DUF2339 domain-containing protein [Bacteroidales bacterium]|nr:DUF2339 domain-containing protein [Bacteroidales bacterium]